MPTVWNVGGPTPIMMAIRPVMAAMRVDYKAELIGAGGRSERGVLTIESFGGQEPAEIRRMLNANGLSVGEAPAPVEPEPVVTKPAPKKAQSVKTAPIAKPKAKTRAKTKTKTKTVKKEPGRKKA
jgi:hypothetical protein